MTPDPSVRRRPRLAGAVVLLLVLAAALELRLQSVRLSVVDHPVRADAREYLLYAHNLRHSGVYSQSDTLSETPAAPVPDAKRVPLYPLFLMPFLHDPPEVDDLQVVLGAQVVLGCLTVLLVFAIGLAWLSWPWAAAAALLTALSPHLVTMTIYVLSETLCTAVLLAALALVMLALARPAPWKFAMAGAACAAAGLAHPMLLYFVVPLAAWIALTEAAGVRRAGLVLLGASLVYGAWIGRNLVTLGTTGDQALMLTTIRSGAYIDLQYRDDPATYGYPYRADPEYAATTADGRAVAAALWQAFRDEPLRQAHWYLVGKPLKLWSWNNVESQGDAFIYPTPRSPYQFLPHFRATHAFMQATHWMWVSLMGIGALLAWLPRRILRLPPDAIRIARLLSLLLLYHAAVMIAGFPLPRYSIALRPELYLMALLPLAWAARWRAGGGPDQSIRSNP